ncbi:phosphatase 2C-like domain-containing protein [Butyriboletus roseoflavus]|nr:phosphatase 2C-like domain-containing protein [Butyriboletus roseoflavus]
MSVGSVVGGLAQPSSSQVSYDDIPGSICGPEDGPWPRSFTRLGTSEAWAQLAQASDPQSMSYGHCGRWRADAVNFQPFSRTRSQDRYAMQQLDIGGRTWTFTAVFDGHLGDATVEHAAYHMPIIVREFLEDITLKHRGRAVPPPLIADMFSSAIRSFDDAIANDVLDLFSGGLQSVRDMPDEEIYAILNDHATGGQNFKKARLCMYGTTALVALVDPDHENLWLANLGDCQGVMISETKHRTWNFEILTTSHNGTNKCEVARVESEHPGEPECVVDGRVLGTIAPFRCIGDTPFKQPPEFTRRILYNLFPGSHDMSPWEEFLVKNFTPPYISAMPEVTHYPLGASQKGLRKYLVLSSDGFTDICGKGQQSVIERWLECVETRKGCSETDNMALQLLWHGLGGDLVGVSQVLTLDLDVPWLDDISIVVQSL